MFRISVTCRVDTTPAGPTPNQSGPEQGSDNQCRADCYVRPLRPAASQTEVSAATGADVTYPSQ